jgi:hypothetical protein
MHFSEPASHLTKAGRPRHVQNDWMCRNDDPTRLNPQSGVQTITVNVSKLKHYAYPDFGRQCQLQSVLNSIADVQNCHQYSLLGFSWHFARIALMIVMSGRLLKINVWAMRATLLLRWKSEFRFGNERDEQLLSMQIGLNRVTSTAIVKKSSNPIMKLRRQAKRSRPRIPCYTSTRDQCAGENEPAGFSSIVFLVRHRDGQWKSDSQFWTT